MGLLGEDELKGAVGGGALGGHVEGEDGGDVVGGEDAVVLRAELLVGLRLGDLGDVVRELVVVAGSSRGQPVRVSRSFSVRARFISTSPGAATATAAKAATMNDFMVSVLDCL